MSESLIGEWDKNLNAFWAGINFDELVAWKGSYHIFIYPTDEYPHAAPRIIEFSRRIETLEDFNEAIENGVVLECEYENIGKKYFEHNI